MTEKQSEEKKSRLEKLETAPSAPPRMKIARKDPTRPWQMYLPQYAENGENTGSGTGSETPMNRDLQGERLQAIYDAEFGTKEKG